MSLSCPEFFLAVHCTWIFPIFVKLQRLMPCNQFEPTGPIV